VGAPLARWRAGLTQGDISEADAGDRWPSKVRAGRAAALLFFLCGVTTLVSPLWSSTSGGEASGAYVAAAVSIGAGLLAWFLPWDRWPRWAGLFLALAGLAAIALQSALARPDILVSSVFFVLLFAWIGVALPRGTALLALPFYAVAYLLPAVTSGRVAARDVAAVVLVGLACLVVGELLAWLSTRLHDDQVALRRVRAAMGDIGADLVSGEDPEQFWSSIALRLSDVTDLPDCDIHRLSGGGDLICLASVCDDKPCPDYLGLRPEQDVWALDGKAVLTKEPVFIASPADPRLAAAERDDMIKWREQAMLIVPLVVGDEVVGLVEISETREGRTITAEQTATVVSICRFIALALHDADVTQAQEAGERRLASLHESSRAVAGAASLEEALAVVARCAGEALGVSECVAYEYDTELEAIVMRARWERTSGGLDRSGEPLPLAQDPTGRDVLETGRLLLERLSDPGLDPAIRADLGSRGEKSRLTVPMPSTDGPVGLLTFGDAERERVFPDEDLAAASALAGLAGEAVAGARLLRRLGRLSEADSMTGLASHRELHESLALEQARAEDDGGHFSAVMLGLDGLKSLNDTYGHPAGDDVLRLVASLLSERTGADDVVGRWAGDKFLLILAGTTAAQARLFAEELSAALAETPYVTEAGDQIPIRVSFGIAAYPEDGPDASGLAAVADAKLLASRPGDDEGAGGDDEDAGDEQERRPLDVVVEAAGGPAVDAAVLQVSAERRDRADEPAVDEPSIDVPAADVPAADGSEASPELRSWEGGTIDQAEMRSRIEETRTRLKVKAFDAMIRGGTALLSQDDGATPTPPSDDLGLDRDLEGMVDGAFSEQDY